LERWGEGCGEEGMGRCERENGEGVGVREWEWEWE